MEYQRSADGLPKGIIDINGRRRVKLMADEENLRRLGLFGLTRQEAVIYLTLLSSSNITGYEISKQTGISKSNTYGALASLVSKGAAYVAAEDAVKYTAVNVGEFCRNTIHLMEEARKELEGNITFIDNNAEGYITINGRRNIYNKIRNMLEGAKHRVYLSLGKELLVQYQKELKQLVEKGIKVVIITDSDFELAGATIYPVRNFNNQIRIIADSSEVLSGDLDKNCLYSKNDNLIAIFKDMLTNEIELIKIRQHGG
jgi:sugar-specific transcriptional regulator TrmB